MCGLNQACPLKTREYLCYGLPVLVNYYDSSQDFEELRPFIFNYLDGKDQFEKILTHSFTKDDIETKAVRCLDWTGLFNATLH